MVRSPEDILFGLQQNDNKEAFEVFFRYYHNRLLLWANSIVKNPQAAEDIVQDFFMDFWRNKRYYSVRSDLTSYCFQIIRNTSLKYISQKKEIKNIQGMENLLSADQGTLMDIEFKQRIYLEIDKLPEKCREVFVHCVLYGKTYANTAEDLGVSINTVRTHMTRAFRTLREKLASEFGR